MPFTPNFALIGGNAVNNGQATMANSLPVTVASNQSNLPTNLVQTAGATLSATNPLFAELTDGTAVISSKNPLTVTAVGTVTANAGTGNFTVTQATAANLNATVTGLVSVGSITLTDSFTAFASAARTVTASCADQVNGSCAGCDIVFDVTAVAGSPSLVLTLEGKDPLSGKYYTILTGAAVSTVTTNVYHLYPGLTAVTNVTVNGGLPRSFRITITAGTADSVTYSVGVLIIP